MLSNGWTPLRPATWSSSGCEVTLALDRRLTTDRAAMPGVGGRVPAPSSDLRRWPLLFLGREHCTPPRQIVCKSLAASSSMVVRTIWAKARDTAAQSLFWRQFTELVADSDVTCQSGEALHDKLAKERYVPLIRHCTLWRKRQYTLQCYSFARTVKVNDTLLPITEFFPQWATSITNNVAMFVCLDAPIQTPLETHRRETSQQCCWCPQLGIEHWNLQNAISWSLILYMLNFDSHVFFVVDCRSIALMNT